MADTKDQQDTVDSVAPKKAYRKPTLESFGSIVEMTKTGPVSVVDDNSVGAVKSASGL